MKSKIGVVAVVLMSVLLGISCQTNQKAKVSDKQIAEGKVLATQYCQSCHMLPDPKWVDARTWETGVLPAMAPKLGIFVFKGHRFNTKKYDFSIPLDFYPSSPLLNDEQWQKL